MNDDWSKYIDNLPQDSVELVFYNVESKTNIIN